MELFIGGDARLLSGGGGLTANTSGLYERAPCTVSGKPLTTERLFPGGLDTVRRLKDAVGGENQEIHSGKTGYHHTPKYNNFLVPGQWPSAGIELETIASRCISSTPPAITRNLWSNWFHFERDGSLDGTHGGEYGYELITEPLPPRVYRDPRTWIGLENLISPWLESFDHADTGLHVHVGLEQFEQFSAIPLNNPATRRCVGKMMSMLVYYCIVDPAFIDRVVLRKNGGYCGTSTNRQLYAGSEDLATGKLTGYEFIDYAVSKLILVNPSDWHSRMNDAISGIADTHGIIPAPRFCTTVISETASHNTEVNTAHSYTIEFRRGKGTIHALSIHRMVELMTMIVRYAGRCCRRPGDTVSREAFYTFVRDNTTSEPLRRFAGQALEGKED